MRVRKLRQGRSGAGDGETQAKWSWGLGVLEAGLNVGKLWQLEWGGGQCWRWRKGWGELGEGGAAGWAPALLSPKARSKVVPPLLTSVATGLLPCNWTAPWGLGRTWESPAPACNPCQAQGGRARTSGFSASVSLKGAAHRVMLCMPGTASRHVQHGVAGEECRCSISGPPTPGSPAGRMPQFPCCKPAHRGGCPHAQQYSPGLRGHDGDRDLPHSLALDSGVPARLPCLSFPHTEEDAEGSQGGWVRGPVEEADEAGPAA